MNMKTQMVVDILRGQAAALRERGVGSLSLFGSVARGEATEESDIDIAIKFSGKLESGFAYFGLLDELRRDLERLLGRPVDIVDEPARKQALAPAIERDRVIAF